MDIRQATLADQRELQTLGRETYRHYFGDLWQNSDELEQFLADDFSNEEMENTLESPDHRWLVLQEQGDAVGFAKVHFNQPLEGAQGHGAKLCKLYFKPQSRARGLGAMLFDAVETAARENGQSCLWLTVLQSNLPAIGFYQRQRMHQVAETAYVTATQTTPLWIMKKDIND